ncbi:MAG: DUF6491 family protein [Woeseiaceae bacterium]|nr:DUF6491 family protein [Woeseiaceae bacterium]
MITRISRLTLFAAAMLAAGCAMQESPEPAATAASDRICLNVRSITGFSPLTDRELAVSAIGQEHYLFTVVGVCPGLRDAHTVAVSDATSRICNDGFGEITFDDPAYGRQSCRVRMIERVGSTGEARAIADGRAGRASAAIAFPDDSRPRQGRAASRRCLFDVRTA